MCGRFVMIPKDELNRIIAEVKRNLADIAAENAAAQPQDVYPKAQVPIIVPDNSRLEARVMTWGYPVSWQKDVVFNTRADSAGKGIWADSVQHRRCIVPSYGFYEPHKTETHPSPKTGRPIKTQYRFGLPGRRVLFMAGIYQDDHFSIMTTTPNRWMEPIHPRMPVVLRQAELDQWLHGNYTALFDRSSVELTSQVA